MGPLSETAESDMFVNCVYFVPWRQMHSSVTFESLSVLERKLHVIYDVSCDPNSEKNPIPVYSSYSSFTNPTIPASRHIELRIIAIDHLLTMVRSLV